MKVAEIFTNEVSATLKSIMYSEEHSDLQKLEYGDEFSIAETNSDSILFLITRKVWLHIKKGFYLEIKVEVNRYASKGVDLKVAMANIDTNEAIKELSNPVTNYLSLLVSQISSNFNRQPIITPPAYIPLQKEV